MSRRVACLATAFVLVGCATAPGDTVQWTRPVDGPEATPRSQALYEAARQWLPADAAAVAVGSAGAPWERIGEVLPYLVARPDGESGGDGVGTMEVLRKDVRTVFRENIGFDLSRAVGGAVAFGVRKPWRSAVFFGAFEPSSRAEPVEIAGRQIYRVDFRDDREVSAVLGQKLFVLPIERPHAGVVLFPGRQALEAALNVTEDATGAGRYERYDELFEAAPDARLAVASTLPYEKLGMGEAHLSGLPVPPPEAVVAGIGASVRLTFGAAASRLDAIGSRVQRWLESADATTRGMYRGFREAGLGEGLARVVVFHAAQSLLRTLRTTRSDGWLTYRLPRPDGSERSSLIAPAGAAVVAGMAQWMTAVEPVGSGRDKPVGNTVAVVKASRDIPTGAKLSKDHLAVDEVPAQYLPHNVVLNSDVEIYLGQPVADDIEEGAMISTEDFRVAESGNSLAEKVPVGERAYTLALEPKSDLGGLVEPGDRVDLVGTFGTDGRNVLPFDAASVSSVISVDLLRNVTVLAVGTQLQKADREAGGEEASSITLSLTSEEIKLMEAARAAGRVKAVVRNPQDETVGPMHRRSLEQLMKNLEIFQKLREKRREAAGEQKSGDRKGIDIIRDRQ